MNMCLCHVTLHCFISVIDFYFVQLSNQHSLKGFLPTFSFLGNLVEAVPDVAHSLVTQYGETLQQTTHSYVGSRVQRETVCFFNVCFHFFMVITRTYSPYR